MKSLPRHSGLQPYLKREKDIPTQVFSCEYCEIFKNAYFEEHLRTAAFKRTYLRLRHWLMNLMHQPFCITISLRSIVYCFHCLTIAYYTILQKFWILNNKIEASCNIKCSFNIYWIFRWDTHLYVSLFLSVRLSVRCAPYLRNRTWSDHNNFWFMQVKWWYLQVFFLFFQNFDFLSC